MEAIRKMFTTSRPSAHEKRRWEADVDHARTRPHSRPSLRGFHAQCLHTRMYHDRTAQQRSTDDGEFLQVHKSVKLQQKSCH